MGALLGLLFASGVLLLLASRRPPRARESRASRTGELLAQAGIEGVSPAQLYVAAAGLAVVTALAVLAVSRTLTIAIAFGGFAAAAPIGFVRRRAHQRAAELRDLWPDVVDGLASAVRAGLALPEALAQVAVRGPEPLRRPFQRFADDYRATGRFGEALDRLKGRLADPVGDRILEALRTAREVGGSDLGRLLRTLSGFLREDARTRSELETRQGWTVNAARLALAAPWALLGLLSLRPQAVAAYDTAAGVVVLAIGAAVSVTAYRAMLRIGRLPTERRVLR